MDPTRSIWSTSVSLVLESPPIRREHIFSEETRSADNTKPRCGVSCEDAQENQLIDPILLRHHAVGPSGKYQRWGGKSVILSMISKMMELPAEAVEAAEEVL
jgi:hypothetical protein